MLYPYRRSAIKNRQRWSFGILYPPAYPEVGDGTERNAMHSECLLQIAGDAAVQIELRFLHLAERELVQQVAGREEPVASIVVDGQLIEGWDEGVERLVPVEADLQSITDFPQQVSFDFPGSRETESVRDGGGNIVGTMIRVQHGLTGTVSAKAERISNEIFKLVIDITNGTELPKEKNDRNQALLRSLLSAHTIVTAQQAEFVSLLDPPQRLGEVVASCKNVGNFPVLMGNEGERDMLLCSPIVLYDYPQIAPESAGDFYDATEMDEMLTLRVMTLTDGEKGEMRSGDDHVRELLQRTEQSAREQLVKTHGIIRSMRPVSEKS